METYNSCSDLQELIFKYITKSKMISVLSELVINLNPSYNNNYVTKHKNLCNLIGIDNYRRYGDSIYYSAINWYNELVKKNIMGSRIMEINQVIKNSSPYLIYLDELTYLELLSFNEFYQKNEIIYEV